MTVPKITKHNLVYVTVINKNTAQFSCQTQHFMALASVPCKVLILYSHLVITVVTNTTTLLYLVTTTEINVVNTLRYNQVYAYWLDNIY